MRRRGGRCPALFAAAVLLAAWAPFHALPARASTLSGFRGMEEYALGSSVYLPERFLTDAEGPSRRFLRVDAASLALHGIPGLRADAAGFRMEGAAFGCASHAIVLSSPVGSEMLLSLEASALFGNRVQSSLAIQCHATRLDRFETAYGASAALKMCARMSRRVAAGYTIDELAVAGEKPRRPSASAFVYGHPAYSAGVYAFCALDGEGARSMGTGVVLQARAGVRLIMGYDEGCHALRAALTIRAGRFRVSACSGIHPVLGLTKGVSLGGEI